MINQTQKNTATPSLDPAGVRGLSDTKQYAYLHDSCAMGNKKVVRKLLSECSVLPTRPGRDGSYPIHAAAKKGSRDIVKLLIQYQADVDVLDPKGKSPLKIAFENGHVEVVKQLLSKKACIDPAIIDEGAKDENIKLMKLVLNHDSTHPLTAAFFNSVKNSQFKAANFLLKTRAEINAFNSKGKTSLQQSVEEDNLKAVQYLLAHKAEVDHRKALEHPTPLHIASARGHKNIVSCLIYADADPNIEREFSSGETETPLSISLLNRHREIAEILMNEDADVDFSPNFTDNLLMIMVKNGYIKETELLIQWKACVNACQEPVCRTALHLAAEGGKPRSIKILLEKGNARVNSLNYEKRTPLMLAALKQYKRTVESLLSKNADPNLADNCRDTALHLLYQKNKGKPSNTLSITRSLIENMADITSVNESGEMPLYCAAAASYIDSIKLLADKMTPELIVDQLYLSLKQDNFEVTDRLKKLVAIDQPDSDGNPIICRAAIEGNLSCVKALVNLGADINKENGQGESPLILAINRSHEKIALWLIEKGAPTQGIEEAVNNLDESDFKEKLQSLMRKQAKKKKKPRIIRSIRRSFSGEMGKGKAVNTEGKKSAVRGL